MKVIGSESNLTTYIHYRGETAFSRAAIVFDRTTCDMAVSICIPMSSIRELIAGLTEMADAHDAGSRQEMAA
ncbi:hypothetical protein Fraau_1458 [Frateuria aurantia DSM 6220]|uniref:Uncharacterized protein n=1 Tax=Frateuria aurantia (strain ATCC 33424 / DSM 6220 / KCTC 2777 / LMG 1558 / NBRC 3245 / NCIMB 13370) TaxID=767434 RepID=H8L637_FRAAD|nr:hypothetical protein Fraau_1458 [Frateuria aurantia DSM 6220]